MVTATTTKNHKCCVYQISWNNDLITLLTKVTGAKLITQTADVWLYASFSLTWGVN